MAAYMQNCTYMQSTCTYSTMKCMKVNIKQKYGILNTFTRICLYPRPFNYMCILPLIVYEANIV